MNLLSQRDGCGEHNHLKNGISQWEDWGFLVSDHFVHVKKSRHLHHSTTTCISNRDQSKMVYLPVWVGTGLSEVFWLLLASLVMIVGGTLAGTTFGCDGVGIPGLAFKFPRLMRASASRGSSTVLNLVQVSCRNWRRSTPSSLVHSSISSSDGSVCMRNLASACHSDIR